MTQLLNNRWLQLIVVGVATAMAGAVIATVAGSSGGETVTTSFGPVKLTAGGAVRRTGRGWVGTTQNRRGDRTIVELELPLTGAEAVAAGWKDPILCSEGRGKYFQKVGEDVPYFLMYNVADDIIGIYHVSMAEMPPPWERTVEIYGGAGPVIEYEHWGLFTYFRDANRACQSGEAHTGQEAQSAFR